MSETPAVTLREPATPPEGVPMLPPWLRRLGALSWRVLVVFGLGAVIVNVAFTISLVSATLLISLVVAATFAPLVLSLRRRGWPIALAAAAVTGGAVLILSAIGILVVYAFAPHIEAVLRELHAGIDQAKSAVAAASLPADAVDSASQAVTQAEAWLKSHIAAIAGAIGSVVTIAILSIFLVFFLLSDGDRAWVKVLGATSDRDRLDIETSGHRALERVGGYLRGMAVLAAVMAGAEFLFLFVLGVPLAAPLAVLVFLGGFIPYVGGLVTSVVLIAVAAASNGPETALILLILIGILTFVRGKVLQPVIYGRSVDLHPAVVLLALPVGAAVAGIVGLFAVIPVVAFLMAVTGPLVAAIEPVAGTPTADPLVPRWLDRLAQWSWRLLAALALLAVAIALATQVPIVVLPLIIGLVLASSLARVVDALERRGRSRGAASAVATVGLTVGVIAVTVIALAQLAGPLQAALATAVQGGATAGSSGGSATQWLQGTSSQAAGAVLHAIDGLVAGLAAFGVILILSVLLTFYFLRDGSRVWDKRIARLHPWRRAEVGEAGSRSVDVLGGYMGGTAVVSAVGAISQWAIMTLLGLPFAVPIAILSFFLCFIPYIGGFITTGLAFLIAVSTGDLTTIAIMGVWTVVFNIVQGNIVSPLVYGKTVQLHPAIVLLAIPAGGQIAGVIGMFLIVPVLGVIATTWRAVLSAAGEPPSEEAPAAPDAGASTDPGSIDAAVGPIVDVAPA